MIFGHGSWQDSIETEQDDREREKMRWRERERERERIIKWFLILN